jgi:hypothetical protein
MRIVILAALFLSASAVFQPVSADLFARMKTLVGDWEAQLSGFGKPTNSIRPISNGKAIEETIGNPADNEVSVYKTDNDRILMSFSWHRLARESIPFLPSTRSIATRMRICGVI